MISDEMKAKAKFITKLYVEAMAQILESDPEAQVLVLLYGDDYLFSTGHGCKACATEAATAFVEKHQDEEHTGKAVVN